jgi:hypothetical protein
VNIRKLGLLEFQAIEAIRKGGNVDQNNRVLGLLYCLRLISSEPPMFSERPLSLGPSPRM